MKIKHLTDIKSLKDADIERILSKAREYKDSGLKVHNSLRDKVIFNLFFESSTRTRVSFETASYRLGAKVVNWSAEASSMNKGESFEDTISTLKAMRPDAIVIRHSRYGAPLFVAQNAQCPVINAGDSIRAHPTQALLDAFTIIQAKGSIDGLVIALCGDISHSRVASSNIELFTRLGASVRTISPKEFTPDDLPKNISAFTSMEEGLIGADIIMTQRPQNERMEEALINDKIFFEKYGLTKGRLSIAKKDALVINPGPIRRGVEITDEVADNKDKSLILKQVENGVFIRMAVLDILINDWEL